VTVRSPAAHRLTSELVHRGVLQRDQGGGFPPVDRDPSRRSSFVNGLSTVLIPCL
jgi:hypothetical protein